MAAPEGGGKAGSLEDAVAKLEARAAGGGASDSDWTLLAQSYEFLGRADDAARARQHVAAAPPPVEEPKPTEPLVPVAELLAQAEVFEGEAQGESHRSPPRDRRR